MTRIALTPVADHDIAPLHAMLLELGANDGVADIRTTEASLRAALSGPSPLVIAHFIQRDGHVAGFTLHSWKWARSPA